MCVHLGEGVGETGGERILGQALLYRGEREKGKRPRHPTPHIHTYTHTHTRSYTYLTHTTPHTTYILQNCFLLKQNDFYTHSYHLLPPPDHKYP
jgi:hypothetical protein